MGIIHNCILSWLPFFLNIKNILIDLDVKINLFFYWNLFFIDYVTKFWAELVCMPLFVYWAFRHKLSNFNYRLVTKNSSYHALIPFWRKKIWILKTRPKNWLTEWIDFGSQFVQKCVFKFSGLNPPLPPFERGFNFSSHIITIISHNEGIYQFSYSTSNIWTTQNILNCKM